MSTADMGMLGGEYVGEGGSGTVFLFKDIAVKMAYNEHYCEKIQHEKNAYERLAHCDGVIECFDLSAPGIRMTYVDNGVSSSIPRSTTKSRLSASDATASLVPPDGSRRRRNPRAPRSRRRYYRSKLPRRQRAIAEGI